MAILLCRIDDRLIHGQVVVGWGAQLGLDFFAVVDDALAGSEWEQDLYRAGLPAKIEAVFVSVETAAGLFAEWLSGPQKACVLTRDVAAMRRLAEEGVLDGVEVNLGGLHDAPGRRRVLPYLFLGDEERGELERLKRANIEVSAQDVPSARKLALEQILELG